MSKHRAEHSGGKKVQAGETDAPSVSIASAPAPHPAASAAADDLPGPLPAAPSSTHRFNAQPLPEHPSASKRQRLFVAPACQYQRLANVEMQLIAHYLSNAEKLRLARVSSRLLEAISQPFAWKGGLP